jgi:FkbM family methyltransferase
MTALQDSSPIFAAAFAALAAWAREQDAGSLDTLLFPAGLLTRELLRLGLPEPFRAIGVADGSERMRGQRLGPFPVGGPESVAELAPDLVLVASTRYAGEIMEQYGPAWRAQGIRTLDLCALLAPLGALGLEAWRLGLEFNPFRPGPLEITRPGRPAQRLRFARAAQDNAEWLVQGFTPFFQGVAPDASDGETELIDLSVPGYHTLRPSGARLFYPSMVETAEDIERYLAFARLAPGAHVLDLGAYAGDTTWFFSRAVGPGGRVLAVEPDPENLAALRRNVQEQGLANVSVEGCAVLDRDGWVRFRAAGSIGSGIAEASGRPDPEIQVPALSLPTLLDRHGFDRVDFIKMDIEGAEERVLAEQGDLLRRLRPRMIIEAHSPHGISTAPRLVELLRSWGCAVQQDRVLLSAAWESGT